MKYYVVSSLKSEHEIEADSFASALTETYKLFSEYDSDIVEWGIVSENDEESLKKLRKDYLTN